MTVHAVWFSFREIARFDNHITVIQLKSSEFVIFSSQEIENHPAFLKDIDYSKPLSQDMEGLMRLKYEQQDPTS